MARLSVLMRWVYSLRLLLNTRCTSISMSNVSSYDMQIFYNSATVCPQLSGLPDPNTEKLEVGCNDLIKQWGNAVQLPEALRTGSWLPSKTCISGEQG